MKKATMLTALLLFIVVLASCAKQRDYDDAPEQREQGKTNVQGAALLEALRTYPIPKGVEKDKSSILQNSHHVTTQPTGHLIKDRGGNNSFDYYYNDAIFTDNVYDESGACIGVKAYRNSKQKISTRTSTHNIYVSASDVDLFPGCVIKGNSILDGTYARVDFTEATPIRISGNFLTAEGADPTRLMSKSIMPTMSSYRDNYLTWFSDQVEESYVVTSYDIQEVKVDRKGGLVSDGAFSIKEANNINFDLSATGKGMKSHVLIRFVQKLFTISMDRPDKPFIQSLNLSELDEVKPAYVSDISYGRICYAVFSSKAHSADLVASVKALFSKVEGKNNTLNADGNYSKIAEESVVRYLLIGGSQKLHSTAIKDATGASLKDFLSTNIKLRNAAPIAFTLRFLDDNARVAIRYEAEVPLQEAIFIPKDTKSIELSGRVSAIKVLSSVNKPTKIFGKIIWSYPHSNGTTTILNRNQNNPIVLPKCNEWIEIENLPKFRSSINLDKDDLRKKLLQENYLGWSAGLNISLNKIEINDKPSSLGNIVIYRPIRDILFAFRDQVLEVDGRDFGIPDTKVLIRLVLDEPVMKK